MTSGDTLKMAILAIDVNDTFSEAILRFDDDTRLCFCHRVGQRWAKAIGAEEREEEPGLAGELLSAITMFRLNAKHLDIAFDDGSRSDESLRAPDHPNRRST